RATWRRLMVLSLTVPALGFMCYLAAQYWNEAWAWIANAHPLLILVSLAALLTSSYGSALIFVASIQGGAASPARDSRRKLIASFLLSQIGKYVPGRIWGVVLQKALLSADLPIHSVILTNLELAALSLALTGGSAVAFMAWFFLGIAWGCVAFVIVGIALYLVLALKLPGRASVLLHRLLPGPSRLPAGALQEKPDYTPSLVGLVLYGVGYCTGWLCLMLAGDSANLDESLRLTALLSLSYVIGVISLLPAGVGSREVALLVIGEWFGLETSSLASVAIVTRLALLVVEFAAALLGAAMLPFRRRHRGYS
ncbi:MAG: lysylphosphatidylglycerol synthase domain-containing protein, partial [Pseudomonadota bacterium]